MRLPRALLRHTVRLSPHLGADATGPIYGPVQERRAYVEAVRASTRSAEGRTTETRTSAWIELDLDVAAEWRVEIAGQVRDVVEVKHYDARLGTPDHTQILTR